MKCWYACTIAQDNAIEPANLMSIAIGIPEDTIFVASQAGKGNIAHDVDTSCLHLLHHHLVKGVVESPQ